RHLTANSYRQRIGLAKDVPPVICFRYIELFLLLLFVIVSYSFGADRRYDIPLKGSPSIGPVDAALTIVEFLDYQ
ncbi:MAG: hypothetical protein V3W19_12660, partial [Desulfatiglandales bacterium]